MSVSRRRLPFSGALLLAAVWAGQSQPAVGELESVGDLLHAVTTGSEGGRLHAAERLYHLGQADRAAPRVAPGLHHEDPGERCLAARILGLLRSPQGVSPLVAALDDEDWAVRRDAAEALGQIGASTVASHLNRRLNDEHPRVRISVVRALAELGARTALFQALRGETEPEVRLHFVEAIGPATTTEARRALERALRDDTESVRLLAATFLVERGSVEAVSILGARLASETTATARREAAEALGRSAGTARAPAVRSLVQALVEPSTDVSLTAAASLVSLGDPRGREFLRSIIDGENPPELRARAIELLESVGRD